jgi:hypothetical protein
MITVEKRVQLGKGRRRKNREKPTHGRVPRVARLMALAIRFDQMICEGIVADQAELARLGRVSRARLTQILNLLALAPDIQEALIFLPPVVSGRDCISERDLRQIVALPEWNKQRRSMQVLRLARIRISALDD